MKISIIRSRRPNARVISCLATAAILSFKPAFGAEIRVVQMRGYSASGTHQCGGDKGRSCVVTGSGFSNCNDASINLQTRDCCPTTPKAGTSSGFTLNYCIPDR
jgi:hypothetical protein